MKLSIGSAAPSFQLASVDDEEYSLESFKDEKIIAVIFSCNHCPYVKAYEDRMVEIQKDYKEKGVALVAINSNDDLKYPEDSLVNMKIRSKEKAFNFPYLRDEKQDIARAYGATRTPEVFVFDEKRLLRYHGRIDDNVHQPRQVTKCYLRDALDNLLNKNRVSIEHTEPVGCTIKWK